MLISRLKQGIMYLFLNYKDKYNKEIKEIFNEREYLIFSQMSDYDKLHSYKLLKKIQNNSLLSSQIIYSKLALLHDCGKNNIGLFRRVKKVLIGDKILERHSEIALNKLKDINLDLANLCKVHHQEDVDIFMKEFQKLDDE